MAHPNTLGPQPDFNVLGQYLISAGNELKNAQNLPAISTGERILAELQQMRQEQQQMRQEQQQMRQDFREAVQVIRQDFATIMTTRYTLPLYSLILLY